MHASDFMTATPASCLPDESLAAATWKMYRHDCGALPVVDAGRRVIGMITDRDIAIGLGFSTRAAHETAVKEVVSGRLFSCEPTDGVQTLLERMRLYRVRRLPVVDAGGRLVGIVSLQDLVRRAAEPGTGLSLDDLVSTLEAIGRPWPGSGGGEPYPAHETASATTAVRIAAYYREGPVAERLIAYAGGEAGGSNGAWNLAGFGGRQHLQDTDGGPIPVTWEGLPGLLRAGADVCRSLADHGGTLLHLDVDDVDPGDPGRPYADPVGCFRRLEPVYDEVLATFRRYSLAPACVMTGRGYHFTLRVPLGSPMNDALVSMGGIPSSLRNRYEASCLPARMPEMGRAHEGAGRLMEYLAHEVIRSLGNRTEVPVTLADVPPPSGGPFMCLDLSPYGDPLFTRYIRCAFSSHQKADAYGLHTEVSPAFCLPRTGQPLGELLAARISPEGAARLAEREPYRIPDVSGEDVGLVTAYLASPLRSLHVEYDEPAVDDPDAVLAVASLPPCVSLPFLHPNPALKKPIFLETVTYVLWGLGFTPRTIASLVTSRYEGAFGWGDTFTKGDAATRARFYVRLFSDALACGLTPPDQLSCAALRACEACPGLGCGHELADYPRRVHQRRSDARTPAGSGPAHP